MDSPHVCNYFALIAYAIIRAVRYAINLHPYNFPQLLGRIDVVSVLPFYSIIFLLFLFMLLDGESSVSFFPSSLLILISYAKAVAAIANAAAVCAGARECDS